MFIKIKNYPSKDGKMGGNKKNQFLTQEEIDENWKNALPPDWKPFWEKNVEKHKKGNGGQNEVL